MKLAVTHITCYAPEMRYDREDRWASIVRRATPKSIAKARPRPSGPVTSQALALTDVPLPRRQK